MKYIILLVLLFAVPAYANDGSIGRTSTGSAQISIVIEPRIDAKIDTKGNITTETNMTDYETVTYTINNTKIIILEPQ